MSRTSRAHFDRFVAENSDGLLRTAYLIVWDLPEAEDLVQETLFKVAKRWPKVSRMDHPVAYARRIRVKGGWTAERLTRARTARCADRRRLRSISFDRVALDDAGRRGSRV
jgi:Sigma-70 region 2